MRKEKKRKGSYDRDSSIRGKGNNRHVKGMQMWKRKKIRKEK